MAKHEVMRVSSGDDEATNLVINFSLYDPLMLYRGHLLHLRRRHLTLAFRFRESKQGIPQNVGADLRVGVTLHVLERYVQKISSDAIYYQV